MKEAQTPGLVARLGLYTATTVVIGSMIGSGIFMKPATMAKQLGSPMLLLLCWIGAGLVTLAGALTNAEVAGVMPAAGGQYVFFRQMYGRFVAYLYGWSVFSVIQTASIASIATVFAEYLNYFVTLPRLGKSTEAISWTLLGAIKFTPFEKLGVKLVTVATIGVLTGVNVIAVVLGGVLNSVLTTAKLVAIALVIVLAFAGSGGAGQLGSLGGAVFAGPSAAGGLAVVAAISAGLTGAFWAYDGWNNVTYLAAEIHQPDRNVPRALALGTLVVAAVYVLTNLAYLQVLPFGELSRSELVAADAMKRAIGPAAAGLVAALVMLSTFGTTNGTILASARVYFAMARDGLFFPSVGQVHPRFQTPARALLVQGLWASLLTFSGSFDQLTDMLIFVSFIFYAAGAAGIFVLRRQLPDAPRPYRVPGYPLVPAVFVLFASAYVVVSLYEGGRNALFGLLLVGIGVPFYFLFQRRARAEALK